MSADCSVGSNPLAQLNKHAQQNPSFRQGPRQNAGINGAQNFKTHVNEVSNENRYQMDQFMNRTPGFADGQLGMAPVVGHNHFGLRKQNSGSASSGMSANNVSQQSSGWGNEFRMSSSASPQQSVAGRASNVDSIGAGAMGSYRPGISRIGRPMINSGIPSLQNYSHITQQRPQASTDDNRLADKQWNEQFEALEKDVAENLTMSDTKEETDAEVVVENGYQADFQEVWDKLQAETADTNFETSDSQWEKDYAHYMTGKATHIPPYRFDSDNQYMQNPNAYEIGCILMENGAKLSEAALAFEAAVQEDPVHVDAWLKLGLVQTQNEKELNGISALEQCLKLDPQNLEALMTISISYINEGYDQTAFSMLNRWLASKYPQLGDSTTLDEANIDRFNLSKQVISKYLQVANALPQVDPDVQLGLGTLFYANEEFDKTIDCFRTAIEVNPNDELMWNRLGASLANSNRSEEAIKSYHKALALKPSFVRARYNLAISSMNIGCYKEAAESLLSALSMHEVENVPMTGSVVQSNNILETLKRSFVAMDRRDLLEKVMPGMDLQQFRNEFDF
ncbi:unnamed protein product [Kluyveromyces dobzhanskii CBS 2104]|uniref:WGS project CCBQ000000000 data, contig 00041 n=1 Tax=Kluyveromyces dobzhanskii CBS 2104 TaxID=1427455 RepID=A0A0A8L2A0_9SACH|nr:unnamed protein product [Kluyveromyces dobzhanskii CBS 2104]